MTNSPLMEQRASTSGPSRKVCMNVKCGTSSSNSWKLGWFLRSGRICELCDSCGLVFEQGRFCETFHSDDAGWRTCNACKKRLHCGCVASLYSFVLVDIGGVECYSCAKKGIPGLPLNHVQHRIPPSPLVQRGTDTVAGRGRGESYGSKVTQNSESGLVWQPYSSAWYSPHTGGFPSFRHLADPERVVDGITIESMMKGMGAKADEVQSEIKFAAAPKDSSPSAENGGGDCKDGEQHPADVSPAGFTRDAACGLSENSQGDLDRHSPMHPSMGVTTPLGLVALDDDATNFGKGGSESSRVLTGKSLFPIQDLLGPGPSTGLTMSIGTPSRKDGNTDNSHQGGLLGSSGGGIPTAGSVRVARPPGQGRGRNQLLPRYWPRITDQELQQITSGDSNATITPLFEKMLSASDAGRIGRLVLPKACAEAYFPAISQPEGLPMKIQDITGKEWVFQFRFWPNNNSRMYVLEGVTPCIQSMKLQAGDTVTFSRLDPEGKLVMGYRRAPASLSSQDPKTATRETTPNVCKGLSVGSIEGFYASTGASMLSVSAITEARTKSGQIDVSDSGYGWSKAEKAFGKEGSMLEALSQVDRKRGRPLGGKSKRLRLENDDSLELKTNWEEAQELLRPPPSVLPNVVTIEGHEFEEYEEPPIFSKRTIFTSRQSGEQEQWAQCDECGNWRRVPSSALVTARWTCSDNSWDHLRASCSIPQEISNDDVDQLLGQVSGEEFAVPDKSDGGATPMVLDSSGGLDALANAAAQGETTRAGTSPSSPARTTKHPRHRPGCTCIVCIQPPSGKGPKHKQNCLCNVCVTVKRRFKTLMLRRKKRLSEREAEGYIRRKRKDEAEVSSVSKLATEDGSKVEALVEGLTVEGPRRNDVVNDMHDACRSPPLVSHNPITKFGDDILISKGQIDLNCQPEREEEPTKFAAGKPSMRQLLEDATLPLDRYLKQHGMKSLFCNPAVEKAGGGRSEKKSDEQCSSQCHDHSTEEASQTSDRVHGDSSVITNQAGAQTPVQMQHLMKLALPDSPKSSLFKCKTSETFSSQPVEVGIDIHHNVSLRGNLGCRSPTICLEFSDDSLHSSTSKEDPVSATFELAVPLKTMTASSGRGRQICSGCHQQIGSASKVCRGCGTSTPFGKKRTPKVASSRQMVSTRFLANIM